MLGPRNLLIALSYGDFIILNVQKLTYANSKHFASIKSPFEITLCLMKSKRQDANATGPIVAKRFAIKNFLSKRELADSAGCRQFNKAISRLQNVLKLPYL